MFATQSKRSNVLGALLAGAIAVVFCLILLNRDPMVFWKDDYQISILPVFADVARSWNQGHLPLLSPYSWVCSNLAGEFQYGTFSIFVNAAVILIWKFPLGFAQQAAALSITHLFVLAAGAFLLARGRGHSVSLSLFVAMVATLNGWIICWGASDWFGALGAFAWLPWAWWAMEKSLDRQGTRWRFLWPAPFVYLVVTGGFPYTVVMLGVLVLWLSLRLVIETKQVVSLFPLLFGVALGFGLSAPAWLALLDYVHGSAREAQPAAAHWQWIVPWQALPGFVLPCWTVNWADFSTRYLPHTATELACGLVAPAALLSGLTAGGRQFVRRMRWELALLVVVLILSMFPTAGLFRWSFRWLPLLYLILALVAAEALRMASEARPPVWLRPGVLALGLVALADAAMQLEGTTGKYSEPLTVIYFGLAAAWAMADLFSRRRRDWLPLAVSFLALLSVYLCIPTNSGVPKYNFTEQLRKPEPLDGNRLYLTVYSPAEFVYRRPYLAGPTGQVARPGSTPMWAALRFVNGYSPIRAAGVARDFKFFTHGEIDGEFGKYLVEREAGPGGILEQLGVDGLVVPPEVTAQPASSDWDLTFASEEGRIFHRKGGPLSLVRSVTWMDDRPNEEFASANISGIRDERNRISFDVTAMDRDRPALLTVARPWFDGWEAHLDGRRLKVESYRNFLPTIELPAGANGHITLEYRPWWLVLGGIVALLSALIWSGGLIMRVRAARIR